MRVCISFTLQSDIIGESLQQFYRAVCEKILVEFILRAGSTEKNLNCTLHTILVIFYVNADVSKKIYLTKVM